MDPRSHIPATVSLRAFILCHECQSHDGNEFQDFVTVLN